MFLACKAFHAWCKVMKKKDILIQSVIGVNRYKNVYLLSVFYSEFRFVSKGNNPGRKSETFVKLICLK